MNEFKFKQVGFAYAKVAASFSKDPSTKVGAAILRPDGSLVSSGWNGFAPNVLDTQERLNDRETKYSITLHAELNAVLSSSEKLEGYSMFTYPFPPCAHCSSIIIKSKISSVYSLIIDEIPERWKGNFDLGKEIRDEANVRSLLWRE